MQHSARRKIVLGTIASMTLLASQAVWADKYDDTVDVFRKAGESGAFFPRSYAYAVFPNVGEGGFIIGAALGHGRVYEHGHLAGDSTMKQVSGGFQAGGKVYSQIIFFKNRAALKQFESGDFQFAAGVSAVAITAGASASATTQGSSSSASVTDNDSNNAGGWHDGMAVFTVAKGGLMYAATVAGQKFDYKGRGAGWNDAARSHCVHRFTRAAAEQPWPRDGDAGTVVTAADA